MEYLLRHERRRRAHDLINQQIIERAIDLERERENDLRRHIRSIIHDVQHSKRQRHSRSYSRNSDYRDNRHRYNASDVYEEQLKHRSNSVSQYRDHSHQNRRSESRECSLVTLTYHGTNVGRHGDEIMIVQRDKTVFKGCLNRGVTLTYHGTNVGRHGDEIMIVQRDKTVFKGCLNRGDQLTFKSKRYHDERRIQFEFYINDLLEDRMTACCEHALININEKHYFQVNRVVGSQPCQECQSETSSNSSSPPRNNLTPKIRRSSSSSLANKEQRQITERSSPRITTSSHKSKPPVSLNNRSHQKSNSQKQSNPQRFERNHSTIISIQQNNIEKPLNEDFSTHTSEFPEVATSILVQQENIQPNDENSTVFLPTLSSTDRESPPPPPLPTPPKRIYGIILLRSESRECSLVTLTYHGTNVGRHGDEIMIVQRDKTVFKGCLNRGDQLTFKSKRYHDERRIQFEFYINDLLEDRMTACCEHALINTNEKHYFQVNRVVGSQPCQECQSETSSDSSSPPRNNLTPKIRRSSSLANKEQRQITERSSPRITTSSHKSKPPVSLNNRSHQKSNSQKQSNPQRFERNHSTIISIQQNNIEKPLNEDFSTHTSEFPEVATSILVQQENIQPNDENSTVFLPTLSSTDRESPPPLPTPPKRIYGPPQLSTMLSVSELLDSPFETPLDTHEETVENPINENFESLNIQEKKDSHSDTDNEDNQNENNQSNEIVQFLQTMSSHVENTANEQINQQISLLNNNSARETGIVNDATHILLTRLGIMRQQQVEHAEPTIGNAPRQKGNVEYFILVYLHSTYPDKSTIKHLRSLVNFFKIFDDTDDCTAFINSISNEKIILILSNSFSNSILERVEDLQQIFTIHILYDDNNNNNQDQQIQLNKHLKIKGFYRNANEIYQQISKDITEVTRDLIAYMNISSNTTTPDPMFIYSQLISQIILDREETDCAMKELVNFSRQEYDGNDEELSIIDEFESDYEESRAIWWFTRQCFLSKMLNKALRVPEADVLFKLRLFIQHLHHQIRNESISNTSETDLIVYLGQTIHQNDLEDLQKSSTNNGLLVFSQFLFASTDILKAIEIARKLPVLSDEYIPVILCLNITSNTKCANTSSLRYTVDDDNDVLLNMGMMGRLIKIEKSINNLYGIASIYLDLVDSKNERNLQEMIEIKRNEVKGAAPFITLIKLMMIMDQQARAEQLVQMIFDDETLKSDANLQGSLAAACHILGATCHAKGDFKRAAELFHLSLDTFLRFVPSDAVQLSPTYNNIGSMYFRQEEYTKAIEYHQKALDVQLNSTNPNLNAIASYSNNVGVVQLKQGNYIDAVKSFDRALKILLQINQSNDPDLASTYDNLADAYFFQDKYDNALTYYTKALEIQRLVQPRNPQALASFNNSIGNIYNKIHRYDDALVYFKRALECQQEYLPPTHPSFASLYNNIGSMYYRQEQYADALPYYLKSLEIELMCLPDNHPTIAVTHFNIATTYTGLGRFDDAIISTERSIEQLLKTLPPNHPEVIENRSYMETIKNKRILKGLFDTNATNI
ncbi:unnamed protein product [Adineta steineri]|uniref:DUF4590 domain-containing protein n=1 Tax=Adineta steineri TaxID=433720 RepID=A0A814P3C0_9BILA|nr:unnamed protein product [Adineta steineri]